MQASTPRDWLALWLCPKLGPSQLWQWLEQGLTPAQILAEPRALNLTEISLKALKNPDWARIDALLAWQGQNNVLLTPDSPAYPQRLRALAGAPLVLFAKGQISLLAEPQLAIVGSRNCSAAGKATAFEFAASLASVGLTITSGLALGIDTAAHQGALSSQGLTLAVLGSGVERCYPAANQALYQQILAAGGLILSEFAPDAPPAAAHFPQRNRLLSGLSLGVLVVEAALQSGSLITARYAGEQGRELFAIPGSIRNPLVRGCHQLIRQGAKLTESPDQILQELAPQLRRWLTPAKAVQPAEHLPSAAELAPDDQQIWSVLEEEPLSIELLLLRSGLSATVVANALLRLELQGLVVRVAGGYRRMTSIESSQRTRP